jgi:hypothetical protein
MGQEPITLQGGMPLEDGGVVSNVATNEQARTDRKQANVDGKDIFPQQVQAQRIYAAEGIKSNGMIAGSSLNVGAGGINISTAADGEVPTTGLFMGGSLFQMYKDNAAVVSFDGATGSAAFKGTISAGSTSSANMIAGTISIGAGGAVIGTVDAGISISGNILRCIKTGVTTVEINGETGIITATKFSMTADAGSGIDLTLGTHHFKDGITVGADNTTLGTTKSNAATGVTRATTFIQASAPTANNTGDFWYDTTNNLLKRWSGSTWANVANVRNITAANTAPASPIDGDLWIDADGGNIIYIRIGGSWQEYRDAGAAAGGTAMQPGNGVAVNASKQMDTIALTAGGIDIYTAASGARLQCNSAGLALYNSGGLNTVLLSSDGSITVQSASSGNRIVMQADSLIVYKTGTTVAVSITPANGIVIKNNSGDTPGAYERLSFHNGSDTECLQIWSAGTAAVCHMTSETSEIDIYTTASGKSIKFGYTGAGTIYFYNDVTVATGLDLVVYNGNVKCNHLTLTDGAGGDRGTLYSGSGAPSGGASGDIYMRTGVTAPGLYVNEAGTWLHATTH